MFSMFKKSSTEQEVVLPSLNEEQLAQVAGGYDSSYKASSSSDSSKWQWNQHHMHKKHHKMHKKHNWNTSSSNSQSNWNNNYQQKW